MKLIGLPILALLFFSGSLSAQENEIGFEVGYGKTMIEGNEVILVSPFDNELPDYLRLGICYHHPIIKKIFSLTTGLSYAYRGQNNNGLNYIQVPFGLNFHNDEKVNVIYGFGFYVGYLIAYSKNLYNPNYYDDIKNRMQFGMQGNLSLGFKISNNYRLTIGYQYNFDITTFYEYESRSPGGRAYTVDKKGYDGFIKVGLMYKLILEP